MSSTDAASGAVAAADGGLAPSEARGIIAVSAVISSLSVCGSLFILASYWRFKHLRKLTFTLVASLSISDILNQLFDLVTPSVGSLDAMRAGGPVSAQCYVQSLFDNFFELSSVLWTTAIAATLHMTVMWRWQLRDDWATLGRFAAWCYGVPLLLTVLPLFDGAYGASYTACWIRPEKVYWEFITFYIPLWLAIAFNGVIYFRVVTLLRLTVAAAGPGDAAASSIRGMMLKLLVYPFILVVCWSVESVNAVVTASTGNVVFALALLGAALSTSQGLFNAFAYGFSGGVVDALRDSLAPRCPCISPSRTQQDMMAVTAASADAPDGALEGGVPQGGGAGAAPDTSAGGGRGEILAGAERGAVDTRPIAGPAPTPQLPPGTRMVAIAPERLPPPPAPSSFDISFD